MTTRTQQDTAAPEYHLNIVWDKERSVWSATCTELPCLKQESMLFVSLLVRASKAVKEQLGTNDFALSWISPITGRELVGKANVLSALKDYPEPCGCEEDLLPF
ncbi:MAG: DUF1902 domain-containing protein [Oscillospiraceae bacterium]|nr:DUF1902 domain-containing protein [Oscillospiraceae bacterium]